MCILNPMSEFFVTICLCEIQKSFVASWIVTGIGSNSCMHAYVSLQVYFLTESFLANIALVVFDLAVKWIDVTIDAVFEVVNFCTSWPVAFEHFAWLFTAFCWIYVWWSLQSELLRLIFTDFIKIGLLKDFLHFFEIL